MCEGPVYLSLLICVGGGALELLPELFPLLSDPTEESRASSEVGGARVDPGEGDSSFCKNTELNKEIGKFILNSPTSMCQRCPTWTEAVEASTSPMAPEAGEEAAASSPSPPEFWVESSSFLVGIAICCGYSESKTVCIIGASIVKFSEIVCLGRFMIKPVSTLSTQYLASVVVAKR